MMTMSLSSLKAGDSIWLRQGNQGIMNPLDDLVHFKRVTVVNVKLGNGEERGSIVYEPSPGEQPILLQFSHGYYTPNPSGKTINMLPILSGIEEKQQQEFYVLLFRLWGLKLPVFRNPQQDKTQKSV